MIVRELRLKKGWSQTQLAEASGLSLRTIQRLENGQQPGLESLKCLAAAFETDVASLREGLNMTDTANLTSPEPKAGSTGNREKVRVYIVRLIAITLITFVLLLLNLYQSPDNLWVIWFALFWAFIFIFEGASLFGKSSQDR